MIEGAFPGKEPGINRASPSLSTGSHPSFQGEEYVECSILCCRGPRHVDDQCERKRTQSVRVPQPGARLRHGRRAEAGYAGRAAPTYAKWMMTAASDANGPTIGLIVCAGRYHSLT